MASHNKTPKSKTPKSKTPNSKNTKSKTSKSETTSNEKGYCVKCKEKREMQGAKQDKMKNGRDCVKGTCGTCKTNMFRIGKM